MASTCASFDKARTLQRRPSPTAPILLLLLALMGCLTLYSAATVAAADSANTNRRLLQDTGCPSVANYTLSTDTPIDIGQLYSCIQYPDISDAAAACSGDSDCAAFIAASQPGAPSGTVKSCLLTAVGSDGQLPAKCLYVKQ